MRQATADEGQMARFEGSDMVADELHPRGIADEMQFILRMHVPDVAFPRIVIATPEKALLFARHDVLEDRALGGTDRVLTHGGLLAKDEPL